VLGALLGGHLPDRQRSVVELSPHVGEFRLAALLRTFSCSGHMVLILSAASAVRPAAAVPFSPIR
jgi:hypothetical protein